MSDWDISDTDLMEALFRVDKMLKGDHSRTVGELTLSSNAHSVHIVLSGMHGRVAFSYHKKEEALGTLADIREQCVWNPSALKRALLKMRELMVLDDLAEIKKIG